MNYLNLAQFLRERESSSDVPLGDEDLTRDQLVIEDEVKLRAATHVGPKKSDLINGDNSPKLAEAV
jgi:hypothetical protein